MSSSAEMKRVITHVAEQLRAAIDVETATTYHRTPELYVAALAFVLPPLIAWLW